MIPNYELIWHTYFSPKLGSSHLNSQQGFLISGFLNNQAIDPKPFFKYRIGVLKKKSSSEARRNLFRN